jgi:UDP-N-acetylmuramoyl-tripeptide--D-alanyl-D-alanine ligase
MNLPLDEIAKAVGGTLEGTVNTMALGYSIDSRTIKPGELFFAIRGPRFDGHAFVKQALAQKAAGAVVESSFAESVSPAPLVRVRSTAESLQTLARYVRRLWGAPIVGVTGSAGKTTTKEAIASVLGRKFEVLRSVGNLNNEFGLPLCLLKVERRHTIGVLEMGMSAKGEIRNLAAIAEPNEGVVTNVNPVHLEFFDSIEGIAAAKAELVEGLVEPGRTAYLNNDDPRVRAMARNFTGKVVTYATNSAASFRVTSMKDLGLGGTAFTVHHGRRDVNFVLPLLGKHNVANAAAAIAVGATHEVPWEDIQSAIAEMKPEKMRGEIVRFKEGPSVIDDSYNSNPKALTEMIRFTGKLKGFSRKIIVAGEMLELGPDAADLHRACGKEAVKSGATLILGVRGEAASLLDGAREAGASEDALRFFPDAAAAGDFLAAIARQGDVVLLKGSRGVKLEQAMNALRAAFTGAES